MRYAVLKAGGRQVVAREGETIDVDRLPGEPGESVEFHDVLLVADGPEIRIGAPTVPGALVQGTVVDQFRGPKVTVFKYIPKERYRRKQGHRQSTTRVSVDRVVIPGAADGRTERPEAAPRKAAQKPARRSAGAERSTSARAPKSAGRKTTKSTK